MSAFFDLRPHLSTYPTHPSPWRSEAPLLGLPARTVTRRHRPPFLRSNWRGCNRSSAQRRPQVRDSIRSRTRILCRRRPIDIYGGPNRDDAVWQGPGARRSTDRGVRVASPLPAPHSAAGGVSHRLGETATDVARLQHGPTSAQLHATRAHVRGRDHPVHSRDHPVHGRDRRDCHRRGSVATRPKTRPNRTPRGRMHVAVTTPCGRDRPPPPPPPTPLPLPLPLPPHPALADSDGMDTHGHRACC